MQQPKFNGLLKEIAKQYPNIDVSEYLQEKLQLPPDKADELATRIKNEVLLKKSGETTERFPTKAFESPSRCDAVPSPLTYSLDVLSEKEFGGFIEWLLEQLGYEVQLGEAQFASVVNLAASRDGEKTVVQALKCPATCKVPSSIVSISHHEKGVLGCGRSLVIATAYFTDQAIAEAESLGVELWDRDILAEKTLEVKKRVDLEARSCFPQYIGSLLQSLLRLDDTKDFFVEPRADEKYDVYLSGVKFPLLTFQAQGGLVTRCVYRIKSNQPVAESEGTALIGKDDADNKFGPDGARAYALIIQFLEDFLK